MGASIRAPVSQTFRWGWAVKAYDGYKGITTRWLCVQVSARVKRKSEGTSFEIWVYIHVLYFLEYSTGHELNLVLNWTQVNLAIKIESLLSFDFNPLSIWTRVIMELMKLIKPWA